MIVRSSAGKLAKSQFYANFNDVDVYVEDKAAESKKLYVEIFNRALGGALSITQVFPLGPKSEVLRRCRADQGPRTRRAVYMVDGDYEYLLGEPVPALKRFYRLSRYCIENYLIDAAAIIDVLIDESIEHDEETIRKMFDFAKWQAKASLPLDSLISTLAIAHKRQCDKPTVKIDLSKITGPHSDQIDSTKVAALVAEYRSAIDTKYGDGTFSDMFAAIKARAAVSSEYFVSAYGSGKNLLMPLMRDRIARRTGINVDYPKFRVKLARRCDVTELTNLEAAIS